MVLKHAEMPDTQAQSDRRGMSIHTAGINGLRLPAHITDVDGTQQSTVVRVQAGVRVPATQKGTHMSRFVEYAHDWAGDIRLYNLALALDGILALLESPQGKIKLSFPWFVWRQAPSSGRASMLDIDVQITLERRLRERHQLRVTVPITSLCPCSKAISKYGAHNQRSYVSVMIEPRQLCSLETLIRSIENQASSPVFSILKREDEKFVTERAYDNPKFAEDLVRDIAADIQRIANPRSGHVLTENQESIHNHAAFAEIYWPQT